MCVVVVGVEVPVEFVQVLELIFKELLHSVFFYLADENFAVLGLCDGLLAIDDVLGNP